jgi:hypothetical protein
MRLKSELVKEPDYDRYGNILAFEEINNISRDILIKTKDIVQGRL